MRPEFEKGLRLPTDKYQFKDGGIYHEDGYRVPDNELVGYKEPKADSDISDLV